MTKIRDENLGLDHSRGSSLNRAFRRNRIRTFGGSYLLNFRNFTIAICFVFLAVSAQAQPADVDKNWTTAGSSGTLDEKSVGKVFFDHGIVQMGQLDGPVNPNPSLVSTADSAVIRYNVTAVDSFFVTRVCRTNNALSSQDVRLRLRYLAAGPGARVVAKLIELTLATGTEKLLLTFDSSGPGLSLSDNYQVQSIGVCGRPWAFDFEKKAYYIEATLSVRNFGATTAAGIQMIQIDNFTRPGVVDLTQCAKIAREIERLEKLPQSQVILRRIFALEAESERLGCPGS